MKCKAGDVAIVIASAEPGFLGTICKVSHYGGEYLEFATGQWVPGWICEWPRPMPWSMPTPGVPLNTGWMPDKWLQPLPPEERSVPREVTTMAPKPQREFVW